MAYFLILDNLIYLYNFKDLIVLPIYASQIDK